MKAIKLASVFAVSAVAAAVSTATFAAEPVFSGQAGLSYTMPGEGANTFDHAGKGELDLNIDTGVVVIALDFDEAGTTGNIVDAAYVKQGAVSFGDFDGSISDDAWTIGDDVVDVKSTGSGDAGIRYAVMPNLTVALEMDSGNKKDKADKTGTEADDDVIGVAAKYSQDLGVATLSLSAGSVDNETSFTLGVKSEVSSGVTVAASYGSYSMSKVDLVGTADDKAKTDRTAMGVSVSFAASDALSLTAVYGTNTYKQAKEYSESGYLVNATYKVGDVSYYGEYYGNSVDKGFDTANFGQTSDKVVIGAKASF